ncbi:MAG TPA: 4-hydroxythreonine-4-phosphate dehydrogenase PdxA [Candidatus Eisenbergiella merdavium]|uniref:4-hydroxythreonine-4-phosphate dehydrogenase PdxA n=1 Tax=Candidatus Eisenbergiella merdavium TaxID=2838551 RepID=A0A9D2NE02_9FIRM|nr:4-hydroxythreonine-4-phosphate dehydrogenase PdxA [Candidatus Eisenbergiella merdavium]
MKPILGITMGDPSGNGPEISVKALMNPELYEKCRPIIIGDANCMREAAKVIEGAENLIINPVRDVKDAVFSKGSIDVLDMGLVDLSRRYYRKDRDKTVSMLGKEKAEEVFRESDRMCGEAAFRYVKKVIELAMDGGVDATVTNALNKDHINLAGHHYSGHTEIYADFTGTSKYTMMLAHEELRVVHVSTHVSLREACDRVKKDRVLEVIRIAYEGCKSLGIEKPKIGVAGLNPHCGENGMFGKEEIEEIQPAIEEAMREGILIPEGKPTPPDTVFSKALGGWYDIVVAMYHDQGHIPLKVKGFVYNKEKKRWDAVAGVNVTLGLPIIRASVDHGTGEGHAGDGSANELSLVNAIDYAVRMAVSGRK